ncbi:ATP-dependent DNA helicase PIF1-like [Gastrolobium bilobum]|uniref:ATP-dependent DNA helicase PIF1-like n=1 Tax=Gastrolobium bilobum TaxID=150636 RepID=UPI002AB1969D|nr:ATP-dependent DNA helicase PIF1-like [Gastrolobium bilobum]
MRFFTIGMAVAAYRNLSTNGFSKPLYISSYAKCKNKTTTERKHQRGPRIQWTEEQKSVLSAVKEGNCVFITGSAGTGKTKLLTEVVNLLRKLHTKSKVFVTASTGVAAFAIRGQTLHSFAGIHPPFDVPEKLVKGILSNKRASRRWKKVKALVVDEIGMVDARLFDNLEFIARKLRGVSETWGGIQLVVVGDFCQLPPITYKSEVVSYAFEADCWNESFDLQIELTRIFRQSDPRFIELLQRIRMGESDHSDLLFLEKYCSKSEIDPSAVQLFPRKNKVMEVNEKKLRSLQKDIIVYRAVDNGEEPWKSQLKHGIAPDELSICVGARVMLVKNLHTWKGLVNGATGTVVELKVGDFDGLCSDNLLPVVKFDKGKEFLIGPEEWHVMDGDVVVACRKQIPLSLAWAMSIHKCQGMTIDKAYIDLKGTFAPGMVYAAISRVTSLEGLHISGFSPSDIQVDRKVSKFYRDSALQRNSKDLDNSCIERNDGSSSITGDSKKASTSETKYYFSLADFLAKRMKRS